MESLYLNETSLGDKGMVTFCESLEFTVTFQSLEVSGNDIHASGVSCLADAVCSGKIVLRSYSEVKLGDNPLRLEGCVPVCRMFSSNHCQSSIVDLSGCKLTTVGGGLVTTDSLNISPHVTVREVAQLLCHMTQNSCITHLHLSNISFTGEGIRILAGFIHFCVSLISLYTYNCGIDSDDLQQLLGKLTQLSVCSKLENWSLHDNKIVDVGVSALLDHLPTLFPCLGCGSLEGIYIYNNPVSKVMETQMMEVLKKRKKVR